MQKGINDNLFDEEDMMLLDGIEIEETKPTIKKDGFNFEFDEKE
jgi:hypothetical protein